MYFFCRLIPPRPTFVKDMTNTEAKLMQEHAAYWKGLAERGIYLVVGLVSDPKGAYGVGIINVENEAKSVRLPQMTRQ